VDLSNAKTATLDPRRLRPATTPPAVPAGRLTSATIADLQYLIPNEPSLWPGEKNWDSRLINPLREPQRYVAYLNTEETQFPDQRDRIEAIKTSLDNDAARRQRLAAIGVDIAKTYNKAVDAANQRADQQIDKVMAASESKAGVADRAALFDRARQDPGLTQSLHDQTQPILAARAKTVATAQNRAMSDLFQAFDRINPDAATR
jgi:hypothetical protein